eukprot:Cvel_33092.t1-p1 / transcript=Cvel_33092.t1 / gene=Cvel_33092 / organism=Chromera_velia_CCMP2878 / gene_product=hypothetical protein / transcript_product=hypothetical protein / location=Cvel_scaffold5285:1101-5886(+) / protein_length=556 / sequence_SO=supercontig / SO=protein_coding / is_pseudo=false
MQRPQQHRDDGREPPAVHVERWRRMETPTELQCLQEAIAGCDPGLGPMGAHLFVYRFPDWADEKDLRYTFSPFGTVTSSSVTRDRKNPSRTHGLVSFAHSWQALSALQQLHGHPLQPAPAEMREREEREEIEGGGRDGGASASSQAARQRQHREKLPQRQRKDAWEQILIRLKKRNEDPLRRVMQLSRDDPIPDLPIVPLPWKRMGIAFDKPAQADAREVIERAARQNLTEIVQRAGVTVEDVIGHMRSLYEKRLQQGRGPTRLLIDVSTASGPVAASSAFAQTSSGAPLACFLDKARPGGHPSGLRLGGPSLTAPPPSSSSHLSGPFPSHHQYPQTPASGAPSMMSALPPRPSAYAAATTGEPPHRHLQPSHVYPQYPSQAHQQSEWAGGRTHTRANTETDPFGYPRAIPHGGYAHSVAAGSTATAPAGGGVRGAGDVDWGWSSVSAHKRESSQSSFPPPLPAHLQQSGDIYRTPEDRADPYAYSQPPREVSNAPSPFVPSYQGTADTYTRPQIHTHAPPTTYPSSSYAYPPAQPSGGIPPPYSPPRPPEYSPPR